MYFLRRISLAVNWLMYLSSVLVAVLGTQFLLRAMMISDLVLFPPRVIVYEV
jgi:hypothetical protein